MSSNNFRKGKSNFTANNYEDVTYNNNDASGNWFFNNRRTGGGCGEPLKNQTGEIITNLKQALNNPITNQNLLINNQDNYDENYINQNTRNNSRNRNIQNNNRDIKDDREYYDSKRDIRNNRDIKDDREYYDNKNDIRNTRNGRDQRNNNINNSFIRNREDSNNPPSITSNQSNSPRKFMSSLKDMNSGLTNNEKAEKIRKAKEYQDFLATQIADKEKRKQDEKRQLNEEKRRELEDYVRNQYRGEIPPHVVEKISPQKNYIEESSTGRYNEHTGNQRNPRHDNNDYEVNDYNVSKSSKQKNQSIYNLLGSKKDTNGIDVEYNEDYDDTPVMKRNGQETTTIHNRNASNSNSNSNKLPKDVDELSNLCSQLLQQQKQLQQEVQKQAQVIEVVLTHDHRYICNN